MTREEVLTLLPEIKLIHSADLQEKSITCWQQVLELGGWDKKGVDKAPWQRASWPMTVPRQVSITAAG